MMSSKTHNFHPNIFIFHQKIKNKLQILQNYSNFLLNFSESLICIKMWFIGSILVTFYQQKTALKIHMSIISSSSGSVLYKKVFFREPSTSIQYSTTRDAKRNWICVKINIRLKWAEVFFAMSRDGQILY